MYSNFKLLYSKKKSIKGKITYSLKKEDIKPLWVL